MRLDRNINEDRSGKYALINLRRLKEADDVRAVNYLNYLKQAGIVTIGNESPGDQFFVMKYKDLFSTGGLRGYHQHILDYADTLDNGKQKEELLEYARDIYVEIEESIRYGEALPT